MDLKADLNNRALKEAVGKGAENAVRMGAEHWLTEANRSVPHDDGTLERSGRTDAKGTEAGVGYDTPYAVRQHEDQTLGHPGKGRAKWLERTASEQSSAIADVVATELKRVLS